MRKSLLAHKVYPYESFMLSLPSLVCVFDNKFLPIVTLLSQVCSNLAFTPSQRDHNCSEVELTFFERRCCWDMVSVIHFGTPLTPAFALSISTFHSFKISGDSITVFTHYMKLHSSASWYFAIHWSKSILILHNNKTSSKTLYLLIFRKIVQKESSNSAIN